MSWIGFVIIGALVVGGLVWFARYWGETKESVRNARLDAEHRAWWGEEQQRLQDQADEIARIGLDNVPGADAPPDPAEAEMGIYLAPVAEAHEIAAHMLARAEWQGLTDGERATLVIPREAADGLPAEVVTHLTQSLFHDRTHIRLWTQVHDGDTDRARAVLEKRLGDRVAKALQVH